MKNVYKQIVTRCQRMIVGVTQAEKMERGKGHIQQKAIRGNDPEKWVRTEAKIRDEEQYGLDYFDLKIISPTKGKHKFTHCQVLYEEVHALQQKKKEVGTNQDRHRSSRNHMDRALCTP